CEACQGDGLVKVEMHFLPDVYVSCEVCKGRRYNRETLEVRYKGKSIADVLDLSVGEALDFFETQPRIRAKLELLNDVGLGYIHLGQSATTLSGGEAQRVKLATELAKRDTGRTLYILDEPTTGLHFEDVRLLLEVLHRLVDKGNTVVVIEHNLDVVKTADWVIDLGPEGGAGEAGPATRRRGVRGDGGRAPGGRSGRAPPPPRRGRGTTRLHRAAARQGAATRPRRPAALSMDIEGILAIVLLFGGGALIAISFSPVGRAVADRIRGRSAAGGDEMRAELAEHRDALQAELDSVRRELGELSERMDFAERLLAKNREDQRIGPARS